MHVGAREGRTEVPAEGATLGCGAGWYALLRYGGNKTWYYGGGIMVHGPLVLTLVNTALIGNQAIDSDFGVGGAIFIEDVGLGLRSRVGAGYRGQSGQGGQRVGQSRAHRCDGTTWQADGSG